MHHDYLYNSVGFPINSYIRITATGKSDQSFDLSVNLKQNLCEIQTSALVDSGAYSCFIHHQFVQKHNLEKKPLQRQIRVFNADATENQQGLITEYIESEIRIGNHKSKQLWLITDIGKQDMIIGMSFLKRHNPEIDWANGKLEFT
jgi:predicted aspartyl protease